MEAGPFDEASFFRAIAQSGARCPLIGRRALADQGLPVLTADYDYWVHPEDIIRFNQPLAPFDLFPSRPPEEARRAGRYALENDGHVDVLVARSMPTIDGVCVDFEDIRVRRVAVPVAADTAIALPGLDDLIATKRFGARARMPRTCAGSKRCVES